MPGYLESTVAQKIRDFLDDLDAAPPPTASAHEIEALLISRVRARGDDAAWRARLGELLDDLAQADASRLPAPECETSDSSALADEIAGLLADRAFAAGSAVPRATIAVLAAGLVLAGMALTGCPPVVPTPEYRPYVNPVKEAFNACVADDSVDHIRALMTNGGSEPPSEERLAEIAKLPPLLKKQWMSRSCSEMPNWGWKERRAEEGRQWERCAADGSPPHFRWLLRQRTPFDDHAIELVVKKYKKEKPATPGETRGTFCCPLCEPGTQRESMETLCGYPASVIRNLIKREFADVLPADQLKKLDEQYNEKPGDYVPSAFLDCCTLYKGVDF